MVYLNMGTNSDSGIATPCSYLADREIPFPVNKEEN
jgi:hypothetical protein